MILLDHDPLVEKRKRTQEPHIFLAFSVKGIVRAVTQSCLALVTLRTVAHQASPCAHSQLQRQLADCRNTAVVQETRNLGSSPSSFFPSLVWLQPSHFTSDGLSFTTCEAKDGSGDLRIHLALNFCASVSKAELRKEPEITET